MYNVEAMKIVVMVNGRRLVYDIGLDGYNLRYEDLYDYLSDIFNDAKNYYDETIYDEIDVPDLYGDEFDE